MNEDSGSSNGAGGSDIGAKLLRSTATGRRSVFFEHLFSEIDELAWSAGAHRVILGFHRVVVRRFPYAIYYRIVAGEALVFRVLDCRRDPQSIRNALRATR